MADEEADYEDQTLALPEQERSPYAGRKLGQAKPLEILLIGGPLSGLKMLVDRVNPLEICTTGDGLALYERDQDSLNYFFNVVWSEYASQHPDEIVKMLDGSGATQKRFLELRRGE